MEIVREILEEEHKIKEQIRFLKTKLDAISAKRRDIKRDWAMNNPNRVEVSDHALVRYLERVCGLDIDALKNEIVTDQLKLCATLSKNGRCMICDNVYAVLYNNMVVTVYCADGAREVMK